MVFNVWCVVVIVFLCCLGCLVAGLLGNVVLRAWIMLCFMWVLVVTCRVECLVVVVGTADWLWVAFLGWVGCVLHLVVCFAVCRLFGCFGAWLLQWCFGAWWCISVFALGVACVAFGLGLFSWLLLWFVDWFFGVWLCYIVWALGCRRFGWFAWFVCGWFCVRMV